MNKKLLSKFFILFSAIYLGIFALAFLFNKTGFSNYKTHVTKYWENDKHLAELMDTTQNTNMLASSSNGEVKAWDIPVISPALQAIKVGMKIYDCAANNYGFVGCTGTSLAEVGTKAILGGSLADCESVAESAKTSGQLKGTPECDIDNNVINKLDPGSDPTVTEVSSFDGSGGLMGLTTSLTRSVFKETDGLTNMNAYASDLKNQVPLLGGSKTANAAWWGASLKGLTLGQGFYQLWVASRNMTYYLIIIPTVAFGFAIMFKMQINPQTQITLMKAIPRLLIVIILITFSYPIAALMVQLAEPVADVGVSLIASMTSTSTVTDLSSMNGQLFILIFILVGSLGGGFVGAIFALILGVFILIALARYLFTAFILMVKAGFLISLGPLILLVAGFPGREGVIKQYFINLAANIFGLSAISVLFAASYYVVYLGFSNVNLLIMASLVFIGVGLLWKAPSASKMLSQAMGASSLLEGMGVGGGGADARKPGGRK
ncbi:hypothetical protein COV24_02525 [candidate division WWE3 bacterium CG10_big_fil_rev_8_21_14_0_10_32_10]|uniref:Uncharacterized protein n=1 Tax=candidate division WWE3 bacterium CG10_big_fil_rev_8_21_14_0_10_32_10 TaxID=1975090 RepID=A0A2H0RAF5_UNCKA|nr:MAG: hypothetical protein COV24_02525 [candidate division WWE3 bacterium CG10_big_fil_rev_8_21_14_0_10_32_10]